VGGSGHPRQCGSVTSLEDRISAGVDAENSTEELDAVVLDFRTVTGIDPSAYSPSSTSRAEIVAEPMER
jgi:hypothetical protein